MAITTNSGFVRPSMQELIDRITGDINSRIASAEGAITRQALSVLQLFAPILAAVLAGVAYLIYEYLDFAVDQFFIQTATGDNLDRWGVIWATQRKAATYAELTARITGTVGTEVPVGTVLQTATGTQYAVKAGTAAWIVAEHGSIDYIDVQLVAVVAGADGNAVLGTVLSFASPVTDLDSEALVVDGTEVPGVDAESDADLRERILYRIAFPPSGGAPIDYVRWSTEVVSVDSAWCLRSYPEPGYCTVLYANRDDFDGPIPDGGGAYLLLPVSWSSSTTTTVTIAKSVLAAELGVTPSAGWFAGGTIVMDIANPVEQQFATIDSSGLVSASANWTITLTTNPLVPDVDYEADPRIHLLCPYTKAVYDSIHHRDTITYVEDRKPSEAECYIRLPAEKLVSVSIQIPVESDALKAAITAELLALVADERGPLVTIYAWQIHQAIAQAPGHTLHRITDINAGGANTDVTTTINEIHVLDVVTWETWT